MSIRILTQSKPLAAILRLEALRQGFREEGDPSILFVDLDTAALPSDTDGAFAVVLSADKSRLFGHGDSSPFFALSLPFSVREFEEILHRWRTKSKKSALQADAADVWLNGRRISLSPTERTLFELLYQNRHRTVSEAEVAALLGNSATHTNTPAVYLYRLRRKLCADGINRIKTVRRQAYRWIDDP